MYSARSEIGGGEWESNPPETGSLPHTDLKSGRPTGDDSPPRSSPDWHVAPNRSRRCRLIRRSSPLRSVSAMPIEEVKDLDRHLAAVVDLVAELRGGKRAVFRCRRQLRNDRGHLAHCRPQKEMVVRHFVSPTHAARAFEGAAQIFLGASGRGREVAHSGRTEPLRLAEKRRDRLPGGFILGRELNLVRWKSDERAVQNELA